MEFSEIEIDEHIDQFIKKYGNMLYRYRKINNYTFDEISNQYIYCSKLSEQDDLFEGKSLLNYLVNFDRGNDRICCFADTYDNEAMWALYSEKCNGVCIAIDLFDIKKSSYEVKKHFITLTSCIYVKKEKLSCNITIDDSPLYKDISWRWQNEARLVISDEKFSGKIFLPIKKVYIGIKTAKEDAEKIKNLCSLNKISCYMQFDMLVGFNYVCVDNVDDEYINELENLFYKD